MFTNLESLFDFNALNALSILAAITTVLVQIAKQFIPKQVPTKLVTLIVGIGITLISVILNCDAIGIKEVVSGILMGSVTAFISMNGFDALKDIWKRVGINGSEG